MHGEEAMELMKKVWPRFDVMIMGRKTYEVMKQYAPKDKKAKNPYGDMKTYVFSRTLKSGEKDGIEIRSDDPGKFVKKLKKEKGKDIMIMGGGELARDLFDAGVIDVIGFNIHPVLLGSGIPLFHPMKKQINLELVECRPFKNGCVYVYYNVKR
jgi:dihydrofolate reductase